MFQKLKKIMKGNKKKMNDAGSGTNNDDDMNDSNDIMSDIPNKCIGRKIVFDEKDNAKAPCAVIVTIVSGSSYDDLFSSTPQTSTDDTVAVKVFQFNYASIADILRCIQGKECQSASAEVAKVIYEMLDCRRQVDPDSFVVNFECCSACECSGFEGSTSGSVLKLLSWIIEEKHVVMFADFSLKSLIADWSPCVLGPNPFVNVGNTDRTLSLNFEPEKLLESPVTQLQNLGRMCNTGKAFIRVLPSTIVFTVHPDIAKNSEYELEILTTVDSDSVYANHQRSVGHAILRYPSGACLIVSSGHWLELSHLDSVDEDSLIYTTEKTMGITEANDLRCELFSAKTSACKEAVLQKRAKRTLLASAPCKFSSNMK